MGDLKASNEWWREETTVCKRNSMKMCVIRNNIVSVILALSLQVWVGAQVAEADFYVSPQGSDSWSGRLADPHTDRRDGPFRTLARARDAVRELKTMRPRQNITVLIRGGVYHLEETVVFGLEDSGNSNQLITYAAYPGEEPVFSSGVGISGWKKLEDPPDGLPVVGRGKVWVADAPERKGGKWHFYTLYDGARRLPRARGDAFAPEVELVYFEGQVTGEGAPDRNTLHFPKGQLKNWPNLEDIELFIRPHVDYLLNILPLKSVDEKRNIATTAVKGTFPLAKMHTFNREDIGKACWVENAIDFLDEPGEWVLNTRQGKLYLWPEGDKPGEHVLAPTLTELIRVEGNINKDGPMDEPVRNLVFQGLTFMHGEREVLSDIDVSLKVDWDREDKANALLRFRGSENCTVDQCRFGSSSGGGGVRLDLHSQNNAIQNSLFENLGGTAILLCGYGLGTKDVNKRNQIVNNRIADCGQLYWHSPAIFIWQSGENRIAHNLIHNMPYSAIIIGGTPHPHRIFKRGKLRQGDTDSLVKGWREARTIRWKEIGNAEQWSHIIPFLHARANLIENNEIHHVVERLSDGNGIL